MWRNRGLLRPILQRLSRGVRFRRRLPQHLGGDKIFVTPEAGLCYWKRGPGELDTQLQDRLLELVRPGASFWDIGANVGWVSFAAAALAGPAGAVLAIEPDIDMMRLLRKSLRMRPGGRAPLELLPVALADQIGVARFTIDARGRAWNALEGFGRESAGGSREVQLVPTMTLDSLLPSFRAPDVLKIDVEGAELLVLQGGRQLLKNHRPTILCEVGAEQSRQVSDYLHSAGYAIFDMEAAPRDRKERDHAPWDTLAVPRETLDRSTVPAGPPAIAIGRM